MQGFPSHITENVLVHKNVFMPFRLSKVQRLRLYFVWLLSGVTLLLTACLDKTTAIPDCIPSVTLYASEATPLILFPSSDEKGSPSFKIAADEFYSCAGQVCLSTLDEDSEPFKIISSGEGLILDGLGVRDERALADTYTYLRGTVEGRTIWISDGFLTQFKDPRNLATVKRLGLVDANNKSVYNWACPNQFSDHKQ